MDAIAGETGISQKTDMTVMVSKFWHSAGTRQILGIGIEAVPQASEGGDGDAAAPNAAENSAICIKKVKPDCDACTKGIKPGMRILRINGKDTAGLGVDACKALWADTDTVELSLDWSHLSPREVAELNCGSALGLEFDLTEAIQHFRGQAELHGAPDKREAARVATKRIVDLHSHPAFAACRKDPVTGKMGAFMLGGPTKIVTDIQHLEQICRMVDTLAKKAGLEITSRFVHDVVTALVTDNFPQGSSQEQEGALMKSSATHGRPWVAAINSKRESGNRLMTTFLGVLGAINSHARVCDLYGMGANLLGHDILAMQSGAMAQSLMALPRSSPNTGYTPLRYLLQPGGVGQASAVADCIQTILNAAMEWEENTGAQAHLNRLLGGMQYVAYEFPGRAALPDQGVEGIEALEFGSTAQTAGAQRLYREAMREPDCMPLVQFDTNVRTPIQAALRVATEECDTEICGLKAQRRATVFLPQPEQAYLVFTGNDQVMVQIDDFGLEPTVVCCNGDTWKLVSAVVHKGTQAAGTGVDASCGHYYAVLAKDADQFYVYDDLSQAKPPLGTAKEVSGLLRAQVLGLPGFCMTVVAAVYMREAVFEAPPTLPVFRNHQGDDCWINTGMLLLASMHKLFTVEAFGNPCTNAGCPSYHQGENGSDFSTMEYRMRTAVVQFASTLASAGGLVPQSYAVQPAAAAGSSGSAVSQLLAALLPGSSAASAGGAPYGDGASGGGGYA